MQRPARPSARMDVLLSPRSVGLTSPGGTPGRRRPLTLETEVICTDSFACYCSDLDHRAVASFPVLCVLLRAVQTAFSIQAAQATLAATLSLFSEWKGETLRSLTARSRLECEDLVFRRSAPGVCLISPLVAWELPFSPFSLLGRTQSS